MRNSTLRRFFIAVLLLAAALACGCLNQTQTGAPPQQQQGQASRERVTGTPGGSISYRLATPPKTFNYVMASDTDTLALTLYLMGGRLAEFDHDSQRYTAALAEGWQWATTGDGRTLDVTMRDGLRFSDGHALTSDDVLFTLRAIYDERTASPVFREAMMVGGKPIEAIAQDARHLRLQFPEAVAAPENYLSNLAVLPRHVLEADFNKGTFKDAYAITSDPQQIVVAGAFAPQAAVPGERLTLKRNPNYWKKDQAGAQLPYLESLVLEVASDANNAMARLGQGTLDIFDRIRPSDYASLRSSQGPVRAYDLGPGLITDHIIFNLNAGQQNGKPVVEPAKSAWFTDVRFRRAVSHAIDRASIATSTLQGLATPLFGFISPGNREWAATDLPRTEYDLGRARSLLMEAGFQVRGSEAAPELFDAKGNRVEWTLIVPAESEPRVSMAAVIQEDLARLGMKVQIAPIETSQVSARLAQSYDYDAVLFGTSVTEPDPSGYNNFLRSSSPTHQWHPKQEKPATEWEARIDNLVTEQAREREPQRRLAIFRDIQQILVEQMPVVPIVTRHIVSAASTRIGNYRPSPIYPYSLWNAEELFVRK
ncbi:MAG TPA: ABC transporter substrate-binding protein [Pyrinomonadaceae bacterium]|jgi:peptide/nickel transport system substrate-binding protein